MPATAENYLCAKRANYINGWVVGGWRGQMTSGVGRERMCEVGEVLWGCSLRNIGTTTRADEVAE